jgi:Mrp family chromosome partitioning ATPase
LDLVNHLKNNCDFIVIDAGPPMPGSPWQALARLSDSIVLYTVGQASPLAIDTALRSLVAMAAPVKGLVLGR